MTEPFFHVFRLPATFPSEYCFGGGVPVNFQMVDWFGGPEGMMRDEINNFIAKKRYASGKLLVMERGGECWIIDMVARAEAAEGELALATQRLSDMGSSGAILDVAAERQRQITGEGWSAEHDDKHTRGELIGAAICYARGWIAAEWLWSLAWWKPKNRRYDLVRAAALLIAEIDRMDRAGVEIDAVLHGGNTVARSDTAT